MNLQQLFWTIRWWAASSPWGSLFVIIVVFLVGGAVLGAVDFRRKPQESEPEPDQDPSVRLATIQSVRDYIRTDFESSLRVDHFDGAFQIFATPELELSTEDLYQKLHKRFPSLVFMIHRS